MGNKTKIRCPHCHKPLSDGEAIKLKVTNSDNKTQTILLSAELGNYSVIESDFPLIDGEKLQCCCYHCDKDLVSKTRPNLCHMLFGDNIIVYFSPIKGEEATFVERIDKIISYGDDAKKYSSYFENIDEEHARIKGGKLLKSWFYLGFFCLSNNQLKLDDRLLYNISLYMIYMGV